MSVLVFRALFASLVGWFISFISSFFGWDTPNCGSWDSLGSFLFCWDWRMNTSHGDLSVIVIYHRHHGTGVCVLFCNISLCLHLAFFCFLFLCLSFFLFFFSLDFFLDFCLFTHCMGVSRWIFFLLVLLDLLSVYAG